jgi:uncharacterized membrane protein YeaQ/YmgE (transglycosylase-associated protein family)
MGTLGAIIGTIIFGAVIGMLARLALPGKQQISALLTVALGVALIGSAVWEALGGGPTRGIDWIRWFISIAAAAALVIGYEKVTAKKSV